MRLGDLKKKKYQRDFSGEFPLLQIWSYQGDSLIGGEVIGGVGVLKTEIHQN